MLKPKYPAAQKMINNIFYSNKQPIACSFCAKSTSAEILNHLNGKVYKLIHQGGYVNITIYLKGFTIGFF